MPHSQGLYAVKITGVSVADFLPTMRPRGCVSVVHEGAADQMAAFDLPIVQLTALPLPAAALKTASATGPATGTTTGITTGTTAGITTFTAILAAETAAATGTTDPTPDATPAIGAVAPASPAPAPAAPLPAGTANTTATPPPATPAAAPVVAAAASAAPKAFRPTHVETDVAETIAPTENDAAAPSEIANGPATAAVATAETVVATPANWLFPLPRSQQR